MYCKTCHGAGYLYVGTGHRTDSAPWAEGMASNGLCPTCRGACAKRPEKTPEEIEEINEHIKRRDAAYDRIVEKICLRYHEDIKKLNVKRAAAGYPPIVIEETRKPEEKDNA